MRGMASPPFHKNLLGKLPKRISGDFSRRARDSYGHFDGARCLVIILGFWPVALILGGFALLLWFLSK